MLDGAGGNEGGPHGGGHGGPPGSAQEGPVEAQEAYVEGRCASAFAAVAHFEATHCLALPAMGFAYLQARHNLVARALGFAERCAGSSWCWQPSLVQVTGLGAKGLRCAKGFHRVDLL